jgi:hypothetical protein
VHYREPPPEFLAALRWLQPKLVPWRKLTIAVDGVDGAGKSPLARFLSWQTGMPCVETDVLFYPNASEPIPDTSLLSRLVAARHESDRPVIVEGLFVLASLARAGVAADILIRVSAVGHQGSHTWASLFKSYRNSHPRSASPDYELVWQPQ